MLLPFTTDQFFAVFASYNAAIWPAQPVAYLLGAAALVFALRGGQLARRFVPAALAAMWLWTGAAYHLLHFAPINTAARFFGAAFLLQGLLFLAAAASSRALAFEPIRGGWRRSFGLLLVAYAAVLYPLLARLAGHPWPEVPSFGVTPCPVTIFTFGVLLLTAARVPAWLLVVPALWSVVGGSAAVLLAVPQDWMLLAGGIAATTILLRGGPRRREPDAPLRHA